MTNFEETRRSMVERQIISRGVSDKLVIDAMLKVPRHSFFLAQFKSMAYADRAAPYMSGQTISQPYIVASMTEEVAKGRRGRILEIGTGSGYQTAVLAEIFDEVYTIELLPELSASARANLAALGYDNINFRVGDGGLGWEDEAPFDAILAACAPRKFPDKLPIQLSSSGGRMVLPVGGRSVQELLLVIREGDHFSRQSLYQVQFVEMLASASSSGKTNDEF